MSKKQMAKNTAIIVVLMIISKILGFGRESLIAAKYGASFASDIYVFGMGMTNILFTSIGSSLSTTFIPMLCDFIENKTYEKRNYFVNNIMNITLLISVILVLFGIAFGKYIVLIFAPGFATKYSAANYAQAIELTKIMFISLVFVGLQNVLTGVLQAHDEFTVPASTPIFYNIVVVLYLAFLGLKYGAKGLIISLIIASFVQAVIQIPKYKSMGYRYKLIIDFKDESIKKMFHLIIPVLIGASVAQINFLIDRFFASNAGEGAMAMLNFGNKLTIFVYSIFGFALSTVVYANLSKLSAQDNRDEYKSTLASAINMIALIIVPATVGMMILRRPLVRVAFERGAFDSKAAVVTAAVLLFYSPGMVFYGIRDILGRAFYSIKDTKTPTINGVIGIVLNIILNYLLYMAMGIEGLALATSLSAIITTILLFYTLNRKIALDMERILKTFLKVIVAAAIMGIFVFFINKYLSAALGASLIKQFAGLIVSTVLGMIIYAAVIKRMNIYEYNYFMGYFMRKLKISKR